MHFEDKGKDEPSNVMNDPEMPRCNCSGLLFWPTLYIRYFRGQSAKKVHSTCYTHCTWGGSKQLLFGMIGVGLSRRGRGISGSFTMTVRVIYPPLRDE